jgi:hypothetical protein
MTRIDGPDHVLPPTRYEIEVLNEKFCIVHCVSMMGDRSLFRRTLVEIFDPPRVF